MSTSLAKFGMQTQDVQNRIQYQKTCTWVWWDERTFRLLKWQICGSRLYQRSGSTFVQHLSFHLKLRLKIWQPIEEREVTHVFSKVYTIINFIIFFLCCLKKSARHSPMKAADSLALAPQAAHSSQSVPYEVMKCVHCLSISAPVGTLCLFCNPTTGLITLLDSLQTPNKETGRQVSEQSPIERVVFNKFGWN